MAAEALDYKAVLLLPFSEEREQRFVIPKGTLKRRVVPHRRPKDEGEEEEEEEEGEGESQDAKGGKNGDGAGEGPSEVCMFFPSLPLSPLRLLALLPCSYRT